MSDFLFDTHAHLDLSPNPDLLIKEIEKKKIYTIGVTNLPVLYEKLIKRLNNSKYIRPALGFHPELILQYEKYIPKMWLLLDETRYIGEVGLDFKVAKFSKIQQILFFEELISRCNILGNKILSIHSRGAELEINKIITDKFNGKYILHWYSGDLKSLNTAIEQNAYFSINYSMVNTKSGQKIISEIPNSRLLIESDYPFVYINKKVFNVADINFIIQKLSKLKKLKYEEMLTILNENFKNLLR